MNSTTMEVIPAESATTVPKNAWKLSPPQPICSLDQVMSEELANELQREEEERFEAPIERGAEVYLETDFLPDDPNCANDFLLAQMLQEEFDREHDQVLDREEKKFNGSSKVTISFKNYRKASGLSVSDEDTSQSDEDVPRSWDSFEVAEKNSPTIGKSGISKQGNVITTKHDANICGRRNACRVMEFPPGFETGDGGGFDMKLSNGVYNTLKTYSVAEEKRNKRLHDKVEKSTAVQALDPKTRLLLFKMVNAEILESINGCISTGKEAVVFHALGGQTSEMKVPSECAIKVFKTTLNEFKTRDKYIRDDYRFKDRLGKQNPRKIIRLWAEKEMHNLQRLRKGGILCPEVVALKKHVLVMSFVGHDQCPAQKLRDVKLPPEQMEDAYKQVTEVMKRMYSVCKLVHADLSEYNILWHEDKPWIIDVSQTVEITHPHAMEFLLRDCTNISTFFGKAGVTDVAGPKELFREISGLDMPGEGPGLLTQIKDFERNEELLTQGLTDKPYPFDSVFNQNIEHCPAKGSASRAHKKH